MRSTPWASLQKHLASAWRLVSRRIAGWYRRSLGRFHPLAQAGLILGALLSAGLLFVGLLALLVYTGLTGPLPTYGELANIRNYTASEVYDANGILLGKYYVENRINADFEEITPEIVQALVATEDARFYEHHGIDLRATARVFFKTVLLMDRSGGGGSTISQQLAKNLYPRRAYLLFSIPINKLREMLTARRLEKTYSKEEILRLYLNTVPFGGNLYGIKVAANRFFNKPPQELQLEEIAVLVGMLKANTYYNPQRFPQRARRRRNIVLGQMAKYDYLEASLLDSLRQLPLELDYQPEGHDEGLATYFREYLRLQLEDMLRDYRKPDGKPYNLYTDGLKIYTTLDAGLQRYAEQALDEEMARVQQAFEKDWAKRTKPWEREKALKKQVEKLPAYRRLLAEGGRPEAAWQALQAPREMFVFDWQAEKRERKVQYSSLDSLRHYFSLLRAGLLSVEPQTGLIRAWVGGIDHKYIQYDHVLAKRQVGSTFKPVVYAQALRSGVFPCEYIENKPVSLANYQDWSPRNSNGEYGGVYSMEGALSESVNTIAVELLMKGGIEETARLAEQLGIRSRIRRVPAIALGAVEASLREMVTVYSAFANGGKRPELHYLDRIATAEGRPLVEFERPRPRDFVPVLEPETAAMVSRMLKTVVDSGTARRLRYGFGLYGPVAGKTGTTQNQSDGWFLGYTPRLLTGVWVGAENPGIHFRTLYRGQGASTALPIWGRYMKKVRADRTYRNLFYGQLDLPNDSLQQLMACPPYLPEMPLLAGMWDLYRENPALYNQLFRSLKQADSSELQPLEFKPRRPFESQEAYFQRMARYNERLREREERRMKRKEFWSRLLFGENKNEQEKPEEQ